MTLTRMLQAGDVLSSGAVATMLGVDARTVDRWDDTGRLRAWMRLPSGHRRWHRAQAQAVLDGQPVPDIPLPDLPDYLTSREVADCLGVNRSLLGYWEREKLIPPAGRTPTGRKRFPGAYVAKMMRGSWPS